jgi:hypothetical protein
MPKQPSQSDKDAFLAVLSMYDRPEHELHQKPLDADDDVDAFVDRAFGNVTIPPA